MRYPRYRFERFCNSCDVRTAFPEQAEQVEGVLKNRVDFTFNFYEVFRHGFEDLPRATFLRVFGATLERIHGESEIPKNSENNLCDLSLCSPWLCKDEPESVKHSKNNPEEGNIYVNITAIHSVADDYVVVQEKYERLHSDEPDMVSFCPSAVLVKATVAFPPICHGEIWTVGWIQGIKEDITDYYYDGKRFGA